MEKLKVILDWFPNTNHTGYLLADKRGWFAEAGLEVEICGEVHGAMHLHGADFVCGPEISMLDCLEPVSYTHLDVYKRQLMQSLMAWNTVIWNTAVWPTLRRI